METDAVLAFRPADYVGLAWYNACRMLCPDLRQELRRRDLWEDVQQEVVLSAVVAEQAGWDTRTTANFVQRSLYRALCQMGFRRPTQGRGYYYTWSFLWRWDDLNGREENDEAIAVG
jgi:hypothetical protein